MKKSVCIALAAIVLILFNPLPGHSGPGGPAGHGGHGGRGGPAGHSGPDRHSGHGGHVGVGVWIGPDWLGPYPYYPYYPFYSYYPYYPYYPYSPYYETPSVVFQQQSTEYIQQVQQSEEQNYWYFCRDPKGYYPYVKKCPDGWKRVVPSTPDSQQPVYDQQDQQSEEQYFWYYCRDPKGYYPYVKKCPDGWKKVVPPSVPLDQEQGTKGLPNQDSPKQGR